MTKGVLVRIQPNALERVKELQEVWKGTASEVIDKAILKKESYFWLDRQKQSMDESYDDVVARLCKDIARDFGDMEDSDDK